LSSHSLPFGEWDTFIFPHFDIFIDNKTGVMKSNHLLLVTLVIILFSCHKEPTNHPDPPPGKALVKLKDINIRYLPSPYYHFEYNDTGNITRAGYSSGLRIYDVSYGGKDIASMQNTIGPNRTRLDYEYANGDLFVVRVKDNNGVTIRHCIFSYAASHQLQQIDWDVMDGNVGFYFEQTLMFSYYPDGNVKEIITHNYPVGSQTEATYTDSFENYDNNINVDGFSLLHTTPHELILVPATKLQINNPRRNIRTGDGINYDITYTYTYDAKGRPLVKLGDVAITNGTSSGQHFESQATFSYYD